MSAIYNVVIDMRRRPWGSSAFEVEANRTQDVRRSYRRLRRAGIDADVARWMIGDLLAAGQTATFRYPSGWSR